jgi:excisionase family DNA binding protein
LLVAIALIAVVAGCGSTKSRSERGALVVDNRGRLIAPPRARFWIARSSRRPFTGSDGSCARDWGTCKASERIVSSADGEPGLVSVREVADQLGVHPETIRRLIHDGRLDAVRVGRVLRVHRDAVDRFLARQRVKPTRFQA